MGRNTSPAALSAAVAGDLENFLVASTPGGIERQEAQGQRQFVASQTLPIKGTEDRTPWEKLGFVFGDKADDLFVSVQFPAGWSKKGSDHAMWSHLIDDKGRERASVFYKAAFYDRSAHVNLIRRFSSGTNYGEGYKREGPHTVVVNDCGKPIHTVGTFKDRDWDEEERLKAEAKKWLNEKYPGWEDAAAHW